MKTGTETILLLDTILDNRGWQVYRVTTNETSYAFLDLEAAKEYAGRVLTNGKVQVKRKAERPLTEQWVGKTGRSKIKVGFILDSCAKTGMSTNDIWNLAKQSDDEYLRKVPYGTWSGMMSVLSRKKKIVSIGRRDGNREYVYRTASR